MEGEYKLRIAADAKQFGQEIKGVVRDLNTQLPGNVGGLFSKLGGFLATPIGALVAAVTTVAGLVKTTLDRADQIQKMATGAELTTSQAQAVRLAAGRAGIEPEQILSQLEILKQKQGDLAQGSKEAAQDFAELGFSIKDALVAEPFEMFVKILDQIKSGEGGTIRFAAAVNLLGRNFRTEIAPLARRGLGDWITQYQASNLITPQSVIEELAAIKAEATRRKMEISAKVDSILDRTVTGILHPGEGPAPTVGFIREMQAEQDELRQHFGEPTAAQQEQHAHERQRRELLNAIEIHRQRTADDRTTDEAEKARLENAQKLQAYQFDGLNAAQKRAAIEKEIAKIVSDLQQDKLSNELEVQQARGRLMDLRHMLATPQGLTPIMPLAQQDQFARMGLYVTTGAAGVAQSQAALLRAANAKLDQIKAAIDRNTTAIGDAF